MRLSVGRVRLRFVQSQPRTSLLARQAIRALPISWFRLRLRTAAHEELFSELPRFDHFFEIERVVFVGVVARDLDLVRYFLSQLLLL